MPDASSQTNPVIDVFITLLFAWKLRNLRTSPFLTIKKQKHLTFTFVSDAHNKIAEWLGIKFTLPERLQRIYDDFKINLPTYNGDDSWTLPMPTRLIVDTSMRIRYMQTDSDYTVRPEPLHTLEALKQIVQGRC